MKRKVKREEWSDDEESEESEEEMMKMRDMKKNLQ